MVKLNLVCLVIETTRFTQNPPLDLLLPFEVSQVLLFICFSPRFRSILSFLVNHVDNLAMNEMILSVIRYM